MEELPKAQLDRLVELAHAGAVQAADAFAQLVGHEIETDAPVVLQVDAGGEAGRRGSTDAMDPDATGVCFEFDGCLEAVVGILFPGDASDLLVRRIVGIETGELEAPIVESALMEVGNILASHVASAIADRLGARLLPSIPSLAMSDAEREFELFMEQTVGGEALRIESRLRDDQGHVIGRVLLVPKN